MEDEYKAAFPGIYIAGDIVKSKWELKNGIRLVKKPAPKGASKKEGVKMPEQTAYSGIHGLAGAAIGLNESIAGNNKETGKGVFGRGKITPKRKPKMKKTKKTSKTSKR